MSGKLPAVEGVSAEEGEDGAGSVVPAVHSLSLQLQVQLQRPPCQRVGQCGADCERSRAERVRLRAHVDEEPIGCLRLADLQSEQLWLWPLPCIILLCYIYLGL